MLLAAGDQGVNAVQGEGENDPQQRREKYTAQDRNDRMRKEETSARALGQSGRVLAGGTERRHVHGTTSREL